MDTVAEKAASSYETIETVVNVRVKVPQEGKFMKRVETHTFESANGPVSVSAHWRNGTIIQTKPLVIVNRHFYVDRHHLGEKIYAKVEVVQKTTDDGSVFILQNIRSCEPALDDPVFVMKFKKGASRGILIPETDFRLQFNKITPPKKITE